MGLDRTAVEYFSVPVGCHTALKQDLSGQAVVLVLVLCQIGWVMCFGRTGGGKIIAVPHSLKTPVRPDHIPEK